MPDTGDLWRRIETFTIGDPRAELSFVRRLARENAWSVPFAERVIGEYKRFVYLAMQAGHPVTPSDEVDQAWHLHLLYTESYWHDLCRDVLGGPLHHGPTRGGPAEGAKFHDWYEMTLMSYRRMFGEEPPADIWPPSERRFGIAPYYRRINVAENWVVSKRAVTRRARMVAAGCGVMGLAGCATVLAQQGGNVVFVLGFVTLLAVAVMLVVIGAIKPSGSKRKRRRGSGWWGGAGCGGGDSHVGDGDGGGSGCGAGCGSGCGGCGGCGG